MQTVVVEVVAHTRMNKFRTFAYRPAEEILALATVIGIGIVVLIAIRQLNHPRRPARLPVSRAQWYLSVKSSRCLSRPGATRPRLLGGSGAVVDRGWLRILGGGHAGLPDLAATNEVGEPGGGRGF
ncbi:hypothetical protein ACIP5Y_17895 [Nocardia sp. NPDC088792]|uniref:hypothetical protein n=1 Tax=Nocardia sp. NPDC088792 TaxID=3364332 RepID=UPI0037F8C2B4